MLRRILCPRVPGFVEKNRDVQQDLFFNTVRDHLVLKYTILLL